MKATSLVVAGVMAACGTAHAQVMTAPVEPATAVAEPAQGAQQAAAAPAATAAVDPRRDDIRMMESVLTQALQRGAQDLARQLKVSEPNSAFVTGTGRARGFVLDGYGMFFDVDVPGMRQSVVWSAQMLELEQQRQNLLQFLATSAPDDPRRKMAETNLRQISKLMAAPPGAILMPSPGANTQFAPPQKGLVTGASVDGGTASVPPLPSAVAAAPVAAPAPAIVEARDPNELYTDSVKNALIDAMLKYSAFLKIGENEWLTVAASDSDGPQIPGQLDDASRIVIRVKGSDLSAFQSGKLTRDEVLKRVEVREF